ncbi:serine hydrolase domain-containing protein [Actinocorallia populi]|uniref:serine hydrolase domain-containing protein n=1 Tax=Actinocorallia populi TaxID=2079200 RepID=UPI0013005AA1|nr:serine hydrolase domain-containing protein [Actinocorallia populi]
MTDFAGLVRGTAGELARRRAGVAVAAIAGGEAETAAAGRAAPEAVFEIGSLTKVFTALALARMVVAGKAGLDEPVAELLDAPVPERDGEHITLRHLATHTSGLPRLPKGMLLTSLLDPRKPDPYAGCSAEFLLEGLTRTRLGAVPGTRFRYSNLGAGLLGLALARRAGTSYGELVAEQVCRPLGLANTALDTPGLVQGHDRRRRPVAPWNLADLAGAGGLRSTAADLLVFARAQLDPDSTALAEAVRLTRTEGHRVHRFMTVRLGWMELRKDGSTQLWHNGATGGFTSFLALRPADGTAVAALSDTARSVDRPATDLLRALPAS